MKSYLFVLLALFAEAALATLYPHSSTFYGCPKECHTEKDPKCEHGLPSDRLFVALHEKYFKNSQKYCDNYWVGMIIDDKANGHYKVVRGKVVDQCGSCAETQVDLSADIFGKIADYDTGVVDMVYVIVDRNSNEIIDGPVFSEDKVAKFAKKHGVSSSTVISSFKEAARNLNKQHGTGMHDYPWKSGAFEKEEKKTTTVKKTTTTVKKTTTTKKIEKTTKKIEKTTTTKKIEKTTTTKKIENTTKSIAKINTTTKKIENPVATPVTTPKVVPATPLTPANVNKPENKPDVAPKPVEKEEPKKEEPKLANKEPIVAQTVNDETEEEGGSGAPVAIGLGVVGAAGIGLLMLKRQSPQKYDDLKQKFPEAFGTVKRSITRGASTIKRGVTRSVSRRSNAPANTPLPASYTFTLSNEDGLPRVALYDDPYPTKTHGAQHW